MPRPDFVLHEASAAVEVTAEGPSTVEFGADFDDLPTSSLTPLEWELIAPAAAPTPIQDDQGTASAREIGPGAVLHDRYLIEKPLGIGGGATVFSAIDRHRTQSPGAYGKVAVKVLHARFRQDQARVFRLIREFRHMQRLTHAGIARVFDLDCDAGVWFITMELLEGQSLHRQLQDGLKEAEALRILTQCTEALAYAHDQGVIHGDLKPGNIFITRDGSVRLLDFGSVPDQDEAVATDHLPHLAATLAYASPQLLEEKGVEPRDDLFSLGCVAYELFSGGQHPFDCQSSLDARRRNLRPADIRAMPARRFAVIAQMLSWERAARPASARDFLHSFLAADFRSAPSVTSFSKPIVAQQAAPADNRRPENASAATPADGAPALPESARDNKPDVHRDASDGVHTTATAEPSAALPDAVPVDSRPAETAADTPGKLATHERSFATFAGAVPDDWVGPGTRLPTLPKPPPPVADPLRVDSRRENIGTHVHGAQRKLAHAEALYFWLRKAGLIALFFLLMIGGVVLSRLWRADITPPAVTAPVPMAPIESAENATPPATTMLESTAPAPPATKSPTPIAAVAKPAPAVIPPAANPASLQSALVKVGSSQKLAAVNVVREKSTAGTAQVAWSIVANTAKPGVDYESPDSQIARFNDGQRVRTLYIPLKHPAAGSRQGAERRFTVKLQKAPGSLAPGRIDRAEVVISAP